MNSICAEISVYQGVGERTGQLVERRAIRGKPSLCKSMRDLATKSRILGDGYYYLPIELWPTTSEPVVITKIDWTVMSSMTRSTRRRKRQRQAS